MLREWEYVMYKARLEGCMDMTPELMSVDYVDSVLRDIGVEDRCRLVWDMGVMYPTKWGDMAREYLGSPAYSGVGWGDGREGVYTRCGEGRVMMESNGQTVDDMRRYIVEVLGYVRVWGERGELCCRRKGGRRLYRKGVMRDFLAGVEYITGNNKRISGVDILYRRSDAYREESVGGETYGGGEVHTIVMDYGRKYMEMWVYKDERYFNVWDGFNVVSLEPKSDEAHRYVGVLHRHVNEVICNGDETSIRYMWGWIYDLVTNRGRKSGVCPCIVGSEGSGKGMFANIFKKLLGEACGVSSGADELEKDFNSNLVEPLLHIFDEFKYKKENMGVFKSYITDSEQTMHKKYMDARVVRSSTRYMILTNNERFMPIGEDTRRFFILRGSDKYCSMRLRSVGDMEGAVAADRYWEELDEAIRKGMGYFLWGLERGFNGVEVDGVDCGVRYEVGKWNARAVPETAEREVQREMGRTAFEGYMWDCVSAGDVIFKEIPRNMITHSCVREAERHFGCTWKELRCIDRDEAIGRWRDDDGEGVVKNMNSFIRAFNRGATGWGRCIKNTYRGNDGKLRYTIYVRMGYEEWRKGRDGRVGERGERIKRWNGESGGEVKAFEREVPF